jgi:hypothetical protein
MEGKVMRKAYHEEGSSILVMAKGCSLVLVLHGHDCDGLLTCDNVKHTQNEDAKAKTSKQQANGVAM